MNMSRPGHPTRRAWLGQFGVFALSGLGLLVGADAWSAAVPAELAADLPDAKLQGSGRLRFFGLQVYDARLWVGARGVGADWTQTPLALEMQYLRGLPGQQIAERSLAEMRKHGDVAADAAERWLADMKKAFPDVKANDRITGVLLPGQGARFFFNGALRVEVRESEFAKLFFGIWLSPKSSEPALRQALLGAAK